MRTDDPTFCNRFRRPLQVNFNFVAPKLQTHIQPTMATTMKALGQAGAGRDGDASGGDSWLFTSPGDNPSDNPTLQ